MRLRLVRNAAIVCAGAAVIAAVVGVVLGHAGQGGALATGLAIGSINGALAAKLISPADSVPRHEPAADRDPEHDRDRDRSRVRDCQRVARRSSASASHRSCLPPLRCASRCGSDDHRRRRSARDASHHPDLRERVLLYLQLRHPDLERHRSRGDARARPWRRVSAQPRDDRASCRWCSNCCSATSATSPRRWSPRKARRSSSPSRPPSSSSSWWPTGSTSFR